MNNANKNCQSCGMPLKKDPKGGGTNKDGTASTKYCSFCFINGTFKYPNMTSEQMQEFVKWKMRKMGILGFISGFFTKSIPKLERWKKQ